MHLDDRLPAVIGARAAKVLADELDLRTIGDLLRHYPRRYDERGRLTPFDEVVVGEHVTLLAEVRTVKGVQIRKGLHKLDIIIGDAAGRTIALVLFNRHYATKDLRPGRRAYFSGKVSTFRTVTQLANAVYELVDDDMGDPVKDFAPTLTPIYPVTAKVTMGAIRKSVKLALTAVDVGVDPLPEPLRLSRKLVRLHEALQLIHEPTGRADVEAARKRLIWDEAFVLQVTLAQRRAAARSLTGTPRRPGPDGLLDRFDAALPFRLTDGQRDIGDLIAAELAQPHPMYRLLQGEVGAGKTVIALRAMLAVIDAGGQAALLAPTEVLAQQHARSLTELLGPLARAGEIGSAPVATRIALLTGSLNAASRRAALTEASSGQAGIVVGTHALLSEGVVFADLGLVVVDEQHRFGVDQRDALRAKATTPAHVLVMTATPIPRTVAMTVYGDLDVSSLTELPRGRAPLRSQVVTLAEEPMWIKRAWQRVREAAAEGHQAFIVCPRIGDAPAGDGQPTDDSTAGDPAAGTGADAGSAGASSRPAWAVLDLLPRLVNGPLPGLRVEMLHGRMPPADKEQVMRRFNERQIEVLVATTVIEVGLDVPNATVMVVMDAERFGVSQLHQLRGRIGRGAHPGLCLFVTDAEAGSPARQRLEAVAATNDGFALARVDLESRREGDVLGATQSGRRSSLRLLQLLRHEQVILQAREAALAVVAADPHLTGHPGLALAVRELADAEQADYLDKA